MYPAKVNFISSKFEFEIRKTISERLPIKLYQIASHFPIIGSPKMIENGVKLGMMQGKLDDMLGIFDFFIKGIWHYDNSNIYKCLNVMNIEE